MKIYRYTLCMVLAIPMVFSSKAQYKGSSEIYHDIEKFRSPYRVLYLAAHPDDENTRLIAYLNKELHAETAYLSITRGAGGQNLIGNEKGNLLGVLRTEELLAARKIDGGKQFFTRAKDFGYSKTSEETFEKWGKQEILCDVVFVMRYFKPHVVINRFPADENRGHGHHHASALLSAEAFDLSGKELNFPRHLKNPGIWNPGTLYQNSSSWWDKTLPERAKNDFSISEINIGRYNKMLGYSYNELSALSRSQHKSQGFGSAPVKGDQFEYLEFIKGKFQPGVLFHEDMLDSVDKKWISLGADIDTILLQFDILDPSKSASRLLKLRDKAMLLDTITGRFDSKIKDLETIILNCLGLSAEVLSEKANTNPGEIMVTEVRIVNRSALKVTLKEITYSDQVFSWNRPLNENITFSDTFVIQLNENEGYSSPYWLKETSENLYLHKEQSLKNPANADLQCKIVLQFDDYLLEINSEIKYKWTDRVNGEMEKNLAILPEISLSFDRGLYFSNQDIITGNIRLKSLTNKSMAGSLWIESDTSLKFNYKKIIELQAGQQISVPFNASLSTDSLKGIKIFAHFITNKDTFSHEHIVINYDHLRPQNVLLPASSQMVPIKLPELNRRIAYVEGPDNEIIEYLKEIGCNIRSFTREDLLNGKLSEFDVLLFGIRSINVDPAWNGHETIIGEFIKKGGLVVVLYQTAGRDATSIKFSPYAFEISRNRVTEENAKTNIIRPEHPILNKPLVIARADFDNWNQERGLYFADKWDESFVTILSWHDKDELDQFGGLIVGDYGKGAFIYSGISFFRHIPYGSTGSYKLLLNILSYKNE